MDTPAQDSSIIIESWKPIDDSETSIHLLPFKIMYDGEADVDTYFLPEKIPQSLDGETNYTCSFRGRKLVGSELTIPSDYKGVIFSEKKNDNDQFSIENLGENTPKVWNVNRYFNKLIYWTRKPEVSYQDMPRRWLQWIEMSKCIHKTVTEEDLSKPLKYIPNNKTNDKNDNDVQNESEDDDDDSDKDEETKKKRKKDDSDDVPEAKRINKKNQ